MKDGCVQAGFWVRDRGKNEMFTSRVILEPPDCLNGPGRNIGDKELFSVYNLCYSKGKATRRRYYPLLYASLGWGLPAGYTGGRCIELGDEPPIVCCVNCNFGTNCVTDRGKFNYRMLNSITFSSSMVSKMKRAICCKMKTWRMRKCTRYRRG